MQVYRKLSDPFAGEVPAIPKFEDLFSIRHYNNFEPKAKKYPSRYTNHKDSIQAHNSISNSGSDYDLTQKLEMGSPMD